MKRDGNPKGTRRNDKPTPIAEPWRLPDNVRTALVVILAVVGVALLGAALALWIAPGAKTAATTITSSTTTVANTPGPTPTTPKATTTVATSTTTSKPSTGGELRASQVTLTLAGLGLLALVVAAFADRITKIDFPGGGGVEVAAQQAADAAGRKAEQAGLTPAQKSRARERARSKVYAQALLTAHGGASPTEAMSQLDLDQISDEAVAEVKPRRSAHPREPV